MLRRVFFLVCSFVLASPATAQDAIVAKLAPGLSKLDRSKTLRGIRFAENAVIEDLEGTTEAAKPLKFSRKEREEYVTAFFKRARYCYRALALLFENTNFPNIAAIYRARTDIYNDFLERKLDETELKRRESENEVIKQRTLTSELAALEKDGPPDEGTIKSLERMGKVVGEVILTSAFNELGDIPEIHTFNEGMIALEREDHAKAAQFLRPLAERGDPRAQFWIGHFYSEGKGGFPQNISEALKWLRRAADQKEATAQYFLGSMYFKGEGVPRDLVMSYMWFALAAAQGDDKATKARDGIATNMTPAQIVEAKKRASEWKPKTP
jgi:TPR repeat protein